MRNKKARLLRFSLLAMCLACLMFGVYAVAKTATLTTSGTVGFNAHDCTLTMYGTIEGAVSNIDNMVAEPNEVFYFGNEENQLEIKDTTVYTFAENLTDVNLTTKYPVIYFNDAGNTVPPIVMTYHFTNTSAYQVYVEVETLNSYTGTTATVTTPITSIGAGETATMVITITLDNINAEIPTNETNFELSMYFGKQSYSMGLEYTPNYDENNQIVSYYVSGRGTCTDAVIKIPPTYNGKPVVGIGDSAFKDASDVTQIVLPDSITSVGDGAFSGCSNLTNVKIPDNATVGDNVYEGCDSIEEIKISNQTSIENSDTSSELGVFEGNTNLKTVTIGKEVTTIADRAFKDCTNLETVIFEEGSKLETIGNQAFSGCASLKNIELPEKMQEEVLTSSNLTATSSTSLTGLTEIRYRAFYDCSSLNKINIPQSVTFIGDSAFCGCINLKNIYISDVNKWFEIQFEILSRYNNTSPLSYGANLYENNKLVTEVLIPEGITEIKEYALYNCISLKKITIPSSVTSIENYAFNYCENLTEVEISDGVTAIGKSAFAYCKSLSKINIPGSIKNIEYRAFGYCENLTEVEISDGVTTIGEEAFAYCKNLSKITIPNSVTSIENYTFWHCENLTELEIPNGVKSIGNGVFEFCITLNNITIPIGVTSIGERVFYCCENLSKVTIPNGVTSIGSYSFWGCKKLTQVDIPVGVTSIGERAFTGCESLIQAAIPGSVTSIGIYAFYGCKSLTEVEIPDGVTSIGKYTFYYCESLTEVIIPNGVTGIGEYAFRECAKLSLVIIPSSVTNIGEWVFGDCESLTNIYYAGSVEQYEKINSYDTAHMNEKVYYYSETEPTEAGKYWHYIDGVPTVWII